MKITGCTVHSYDHTIHSRLVSMNNPEKHFFIHKKGVDIEEGGDFITLENELKRNGHMDSEITYLKVSHMIS